MSIFVNRGARTRRSQMMRVARQSLGIGASPPTDRGVGQADAGLRYDISPSVVSDSWMKDAAARTVAGRTYVSPTDYAKAQTGSTGRFSFRDLKRLFKNHAVFVSVTGEPNQSAYYLGDNRGLSDRVSDQRLSRGFFVVAPGGRYYVPSHVYRILRDRQAVVGDPDFVASRYVAIAKEHERDYNLGITATCRSTGLVSRAQAKLLLASGSSDRCLKAVAEGCPTGYSKGLSFCVEGQTLIEHPTEKGCKHCETSAANPSIFPSAFETSPAPSATRTQCPEGYRPRAAYISMSAGLPLCPDGQEPEDHPTAANCYRCVESRLVCPDKYGSEGECPPGFERRYHPRAAGCYTCVAPEQERPAACPENYLPAVACPEGWEQRAHPERADCFSCFKLPASTAAAEEGQPGPEGQKTEEQQAEKKGLNPLWYILGAAGLIWVGGSGGGGEGA